MNVTKWRGGTTAFALLAMILGVAAWAGEKPQVRVEGAETVGPRTLEDQTREAVVRDYLAAWQTMGKALADNNVSQLNADFVGFAKDRLAKTIRDQQKLNIATRYQDRRHDISLIFYSPEGLSVQLLDNVEYDVQILDHEKLQATQHVRARYIAVLSPTEVQWKVRILQATQ